MQDKLRPERERVSWTKPGNIHLTLKFLGDVDGSAIPAIQESLTYLLSDQKRCKFQIGGLGAFPNMRKARVLWVGVIDATGGLSRLAKMVDRALIPLGFSAENRKFTPHLTLGRVKSQLGSAFVRKFNDITFPEVDALAEEIVLMKSDLQPTGAVYTPLHQVRLA